MIAECTCTGGWVSCTQLQTRTEQSSSQSMTSYNPEDHNDCQVCDGSKLLVCSFCTFRTMPLEEVQVWAAKNISLDGSSICSELIRELEMNIDFRIRGPIQVTREHEEWHKCVEKGRRYPLRSSCTHYWRPGALAECKGPECKNCAGRTYVYRNQRDHLWTVADELGFDIFTYTNARTVDVLLPVGATQRTVNVGPGEGLKGEHAILVGLCRAFKNQQDNGEVK